MAVNTMLLSDFTDSRFCDAFQTYFSELDISVSDWEGLFREMNEEGTNLAYILQDEEENLLGFLQFQMTSFTNWFLEEPFGFIREFWVDPAYRRQGFGTRLLDLAERYFMEHGAYRALLTADDAAAFYLAKDYRKVPGVKAKNELEVLSKMLDRKE